MSNLLHMENVRVHIKTRALDITALELDHLSLARGEMLALVGETGSGKSMTASSIMQLFPTQKARVTAGKIMFDGRDLLGCKQSELDRIRGEEITMIFQDPMSSLNPVFRIGDPIIDVIQMHTGVSKIEARDQAIRALRYVGLPDPGRLMQRFPHELSGGQRQRVMIAMAIVCEPRMLIADEPTTALDVTIQSQILFLIDKLKREKGTSVLFITHNLGIVSKMADRIAVLYGGRIVETGPTREVLKHPRHPYTRMLLEAIPRIKDKRDRLPVIGGRVSSPAEPIRGCRFANRCPRVSDLCQAEVPTLATASDEHEIACFHPVEEKR
ncbi:ABC transporter ATP-binding protein [Brevibacillus fluminis]|uniref:ABC transporter ATP-binding protein n=1 Tax=Brevibacillus fluminis TaxID=511487 RepID=A0A3M8D1Y7_9BACL|nr:ABC transporter ATP-binding protein [Brevibacillus fluminis]RNB81205.1 ABC transporter ATP-binding protein [Brevibacillus fluminis]